MPEITPPASAAARRRPRSYAIILLLRWLVSAAGVFLLLAGVAFIILSFLKQTSPEPFIAWARQNAIPLATAEPGSPAADLAPLGQAVGDARMVALGEAARGSHEFIAFKYRFFEYLVEQKGFTAIILEVSLPEAARLNGYIVGGPGDPEALVHGLRSWTTDTEETVELVRWMRAWNDAPGRARKIQLYGCDIFPAKVAVVDALAYLGRIDPAFAAAHQGALAALVFDDERALAQAYVNLSPAAFERATAEFDGLIHQLQTNRGAYIAKSSAGEWDFELREAILARQAHGFYAAIRQDASGRLSLIERERYLAENALWALDREGPQGKIVLSSHNDEVKKWSGFVAPLPFGGMLSQILGSQFVSFGFSFGHGTFVAHLAVASPNDLSKIGNVEGLKANSVGAARPGSVASVLAQVGPPMFALDLRRAPASGPISRWLRWNGGGMRSIGAIYVPNHDLEYAPPGREFDGIVYFDSVSAANFTPLARETYFNQRPAPSAGSPAPVPGSPAAAPPPGKPAPAPQ
ncbi:MAG TPA: erythromycin esterase family protein [Candidatus Acidoferrales bacterium]|jgi:erythromycin esterase|nr:erythromycin esterase family protein [Candidatus Acidoferrales bacterium]